SGNGDETSVASGSIPARNSSPHCTTRRGGTVARMAPATGMASTEPSAGPSRVSPSTPGDRFSAALIAGMRAAQVPEDSPSTPKTMVTGARAARLAQWSATRAGPAAAAPPGASCPPGLLPERGMPVLPRAGGFQLGRQRDQQALAAHRPGQHDADRQPAAGPVQGQV